jgi:thiamine-monophosphate kinase
MSTSGPGEFEIIDLFRGGGHRHPWVLDGIGDDCAVLDLGGERCLLVTTDLLVERVHYLRERISPWQLGWKAMAVSISDIAAMGGTPKAAFAAAGLAPGLDLAFLEGLRDGMLACAEGHGVDLLGGDTSRAARDGLLCVTLLGEIPRAEVLRRSGARPGDVAFLGGPVGLSAAGLWALTRGEVAAARLPEALHQQIVQAHLEPQPQVALGRWLAQGGMATAMMDVSDGVLQDLGHICRASGVGALVAGELLPLEPAVKAAAALGCATEPWRFALSGGEDYVLLFTAPAEHQEALIHGARAELGVELIPFAWIEEQPGLRLFGLDGIHTLEPEGWDHFGGPGAG